MSNLMITHILYQLMGKFGVASDGFRKVLAVFISLMIFGLMFLVVRFTGMQIPNFTRNLVMLAAVDLAGFGFLMWKQKPSEKPVEPTQPIELTQEQPIQQTQEQSVEQMEVVEKQVEEKKEEKDDVDNEEVDRLMAEIIEENKEREKEIEEEMKQAT